MKRLSKHDVNKLTASELVNELPFELTNDNEVIAVVLPICDVNRLEKNSKATHDVNKELKFSKGKQAKGGMR